MSAPQASPMLPAQWFAMQFGTAQSEGVLHASPTAPVEHVPFVHTELWQWVPEPHGVPDAPVTQTLG